MTSQNNESAAKPASEGHKEVVLVDDEPRCCRKPEEHKRCESVFVTCEFCKGKIDVCKSCEGNVYLEIKCAECLHSSESRLSRKIRSHDTCDLFTLASLIFVFICIGLFGTIGEYKIYTLGGRIAEVESRYSLLKDAYHDSAVHGGNMANAIHQLAKDVSALRAALSELEKRRAPDPVAARELHGGDSLTFKSKCGDDCWIIKGSNGKVYKTETVYALAMNYHSYTIDVVKWIGHVDTNDVYVVSSSIGNQVIAGKDGIVFMFPITTHDEAH